MVEPIELKNNLSKGKATPQNSFLLYKLEAHNIYRAQKEIKIFKKWGKNVWVLWKWLAISKRHKF